MLNAAGGPYIETNSDTLSGDHHVSKQPPLEPPPLAMEPLPAALWQQEVWTWFNILQGQMSKLNIILEKILNMAAMETNERRLTDPSNYEEYVSIISSR